MVLWQIKSTNWKEKLKTTWSNSQSNDFVTRYQVFEQSSLFYAMSVELVDWWKCVHIAHTLPAWYVSISGCFMYEYTPPCSVSLCKLKAKTPSLLPPTYELRRKVMFPQVSVHSQERGGYHWSLFMVKFCILLIPKVCVMDGSFPAGVRVPLNRALGNPPPPPPRVDRLCRGQYASCDHVGGLSCVYFLFVQLHYIYIIIGLVVVTQIT